MSKHIESLSYTLSFGTTEAGLHPPGPTRAFVFREPGEAIWIDHIPYPTHRNHLYIIPRGHYCFLPESVVRDNVASIHVNEAEIDDPLTLLIYQHLLYKITYTDDKVFFVAESGKSAYDTLLSCDEYPDEHRLASVLSDWSRAMPGYPTGGPPSKPRIDRVSYFLNQLPSSLDQGCLINKLTDIRGYGRTTRSTLCRDCNDLLGVSPNRVIQYHKTAAATAAGHHRSYNTADHPLCPRHLHPHCLQRLWQYYRLLVRTWMQRHHRLPDCVLTEW